VLRCMAEPEPRNKLSHVNTLDDVVSLLKSSSKIIVLTGAGVSPQLHVLTLITIQWSGKLYSLQIHLNLGYFLVMVIR